MIVRFRVLRRKISKTKKKKGFKKIETIRKRERNINLHTTSNITIKTFRNTMVWFGLVWWHINHWSFLIPHSLYTSKYAKYIRCSLAGFYGISTILGYCYGDISYHTPKMDSSNLNIFSELARSGRTISRFLRDIWQTDRQTDCKPRTACTSFVWLPFPANTITFTYHPLFELFFHRSYLKITTVI